MAVSGMSWDIDLFIVLDDNIAIFQCMELFENFNDKVQINNIIILSVLVALNDTFIGDKLQHHLRI